jgi:protoheme IX farnesyltransferase
VTVELAPRTAAPARAAGWARAGDFLSFVKPHIDVTFVAVAVAGAVVAWHWSGPFPLSRVLILAGSVALLSAGAECWTNIRDRDLDAVMPRTQGRPLVSGRISLLEALLLAVVLTGLGLVLAALLGPVALAFLAFALLSNVVVYSLLTKRATPWSIVLGSVVGALPLWAGAAAVREPLPGSTWMLGGTVGVWIFVHIWVIAVRYRDDYAAGSVPMAPLVWSPRRLRAGLVISAAGMGTLATGSLLRIGGAAAPAAAALVGACSAAILVGAELVPTRPKLAGPLIRLITIYLVVVLGAAVACAL